MSRFHDLCETNDDQFLKFEQVPKDRRLGTKRPDIHAFLLLDRLVPGESDVVSGAGHDEIWLDVEVEKLEKVATDDDLLELYRCGVRYDEEHEALVMFV